MARTRFRVTRRAPPAVCEKPEPSVEEIAERMRRVAEDARDFWEKYRQMEWERDEWKKRAERAEEELRKRKA